MRLFSRLTALCAVLTLPAVSQAAQVRNDLAMALERTSAIVDTLVIGATHTFDAQLGPRATLTCADPQVFSGEPNLPAGNLVLQLLGGYTSPDLYLRASHVPHVAANTRYILFLRNDLVLKWFDSPIVGPYAFAILSNGGREYVVDQSGHVVMGIDGVRLVLSDAPLFDVTFDFATPFAAPVPLAEVDSQVEASALHPQAFLDELQVLMDGLGIKPSGEFTIHPDLSRTWDVRPAFDGGYPADVFCGAALCEEQSPDVCTPGIGECL